MNEAKGNHLKPGRNNKLLLYVVDDEPMLLELASMILEPLGYAIQTFRDGESAVQAFTATKRRPALVITDYAMHAMTGLDVVEACRRIQPDQKVLLVSGTVDETVYANSTIKPDRFLPKPYQAKQLIDLVESVLAD